MPAITAMAVMKSMPLTTNREVVIWLVMPGPVYVDASAKMTAKNNKTATATPPII